MRKLPGLIWQIEPADEPDEILPAHYVSGSWYITDVVKPNQRCPFGRSQLGMSVPSFAIHGQRLVSSRDKGSFWVQS